VRNLIAATSAPHLLGKGIFPADVEERAQTLLKEIVSTGAYSHSKGISSIRQSVCKFIKQRDGLKTDVDPENIFLSNGASTSIQLLLSLLLRNGSDGIAVPIPQYPLYSATITLLGGQLLPYSLKEDFQKDSWVLSKDALAKSLLYAQEKRLNARALVVINPGNPVGTCMSYQNIKEVIEFCHANKLLIIADEVYQTNIYSSTPFVSFRRVLEEMGAPYNNEVELASFHSASKGVLGECGYRGGYGEFYNFSEEALNNLYKVASIQLCSNTTGQLVMEAILNPPKPGQPSYKQHVTEEATILKDLTVKSKMIREAFNKLPNMKCITPTGAMYAFPQIILPTGAIAAAQTAKKRPDMLYCLELLRAIGVCVVPGSGFGQEEGTFHFRTTFLPPTPILQEVLKNMAAFHLSFLKKYS
jgi:alanine transaminase